MKMIKFNLYNVTNGTIKARVSYSLDNRHDGRNCVTMYEKDYDRNIHKIFDEAVNNTDSMTDYFASSKVTLFEDHPLYAKARATAERLAEKRGY
jgi:hypothetical protein